MLKVLKRSIDSVEPELEEAALRVLLAFGGVVFFLLSGTQPGARAGFLACAVYLAWSAGLGAVIARFPRPAAVRRATVLAVDQISVSAVLGAAGLLAAPTLVVYLWVILGASMRYGNRYGSWAALLAVLGLGCVAALQPEWREQRGLLWSWLFVLAAAPAYVGLLARRAEQRVERYRKQSQELAIAATHDGMTGLPNREHFRSAVEAALEHLRAAGNGALAVLFVDLDGFKSCNDLYGHAAGDELLRMIANDMRATIRSSDVAARLGGDEFAILLTGLRSVNDAARIGSAIIRRTQAVRTVGGHAVRISASAGISYVRAQEAHGIDTAVVVGRADRAMLRAKRSGKNTFRLATGPQSIIREFDLAGQERPAANDARRPRDSRPPAGTTAAK